MVEPVRARQLADQEGQRLQQIVRRGKHGSVRVRRAVIKLAAYLAGRDRPVRVGRERLRQIVHARGVSFQRTRTWKESTDPDRTPSWTGWNT